MVQDGPVRFVTYSITKVQPPKKSSTKASDAIISKLVASGEDNEPIDKQLVVDSLSDHTVTRSKDFEPHLSMFVMLCQAQGDVSS